MHPKILHNARSDILRDEKRAEFWNDSARYQRFSPAETISDEENFQDADEGPLDSIRRPEVNYSKCLCRAWSRVKSTPHTSHNNVQCKHNCIDGSSICEMHKKKMKCSPNGKWWLGLITEPRSEEPFGPFGTTQKAKRHYWLDQTPDDNQ